MWTNQDHLIGIESLIKALNSGDYVDCTALAPLYHCNQDVSSDDHGWTTLSLGFGAFAGSGDGWQTTQFTEGGQLKYSGIFGPEYSEFVDITRVEVDVDWVTVTGNNEGIGIYGYHLGSFTAFGGSSQFSPVSGFHTYIWTFVTPVHADNLFINPHGWDGGLAQVIGLRIFGPGTGPTIVTCD